MQVSKIKLDFDAAYDFVKTASKCDFDIDVFYNRVIIDAKSILGVLGLDFGRILTVKYNGQDPEFESFLQRYSAA